MPSVGADEVALDHVAGRPGLGDVDTGALPEMRLPAPAAVPPTVLPVAPLSMSTPSGFGIAGVPGISVPTRLPWIGLPDVPGRR